MEDMSDEAEFYNDPARIHAFWYVVSPPELRPPHLKRVTRMLPGFAGVLQEGAGALLLRRRALS